MSTVMENKKKKSEAPFEVKQALMGFDMTELDEVLLRYVSFLNTQFPIHSIYGMHVVPSFELYKALLFSDSEEMEGIYLLNENLVQQMKRLYDKVKAERKLPKFQCTASEGDPLEELLNWAEEINPDLVVIGRREKPNSFGILPKNLVRKAEANVLIIPEKPTEQLKTILVPIDFSENSARALQEAARLVSQMKTPARIIAAHVFSMPTLSVYQTSKTMDQFGRMIRDNIEDAFAAFINKLNEADVEIEMLLIEQDMPGISSYLVQHAEQSAADLIIIGVKGHSNVELLLLGSVTEKLLNLNHNIPVLVIK